jgi:hypothetical protein
VFFAVQAGREGWIGLTSGLRTSKKTVKIKARQGFSCATGPGADRRP